MVFSSILFLWVFLPTVLGCYYIAPKRFRNGLLTVFSLFFYAWGEPKYIALMLLSVLLNYGFGLTVERFGKRRRLLAACVALNLLILGYYKYAGFTIECINALMHRTGRTLRAADIPLPVGISFYTFQALSYVVDVYRGEHKAQRSLLHVMLYISFFPQLIAGPIVKYHDIERQLEDRHTTAEQFSYGIKRFILGLGKKVILANSFAEVVDRVYAYQPGDVSQPLLWLAAILYMLQIYYDFSGYSDMAIGLGRMFGFTFQENFNLPYTAVSVRDFWRRWHISLSGWFREYVYIPLGGSRKGTARTCLNLGLVFLLTGIWHGAGWTFLFWGLYHGAFLILERAFLEKWMEKHSPKPLRYAYTWFAVLIGWIFFRAESMSQAGRFLYHMFVPHQGVITAGAFMDFRLAGLLIMAVLGSGVIQRVWERMTGGRPASDGDVTAASAAGYMGVLWICILWLVSNTYNPFIYFRF